MPLSHASLLRRASGKANDSGKHQPSAQLTCAKENPCESKLQLVHNLNGQLDF